MTVRSDLAEALATVGQQHQLEQDSPYLNQGQTPVEKRPSKKRGRMWLLIVGLAVSLLAAGWWQQKAIIQYAVHVPLVGPLLPERLHKALTEPADPLAFERSALAQQERNLLQREQDALRYENDLTARNDALVSRELALDAREAALVEKEEAFAASLPGPGINELVDIYRNMKPDAAAPLVAELDNLTAIVILRRVDSQLAARILAAMETERAAELSRALAAQGGP